MRFARRALVLALGLGLAGCGGLLPPPPPPPDLYTLSPASPSPAESRPHRAVQILVGDIAAPAALDTTRIALNHDPTRVEYFAKADWTDRAPLLVRNLLRDTLERSGAFKAVALRSLALRADYVVLGDLRHFEADYSAGSPPQIRVAVELEVVRGAGGEILGQKTFAASVPAAANAIPAIVNAFDAAAHDALKNATPWVASLLPPAAGK
jgi:cholesterol transport system auxiliary component